MKNNNTLDQYAEQFSQLESRTSGNSADWLRSARKTALERFLELGFPTTRHEDWRFTNPAPVTSRVFKASRQNDVTLSESRLEPYRLKGEETLLVFVNGRFAKGLSSIGSLPSEVFCGSIAEAIEAGLPALEQHLGQYAKCDTDAFTALNTAFVEDGAVVVIPKGQVLEEPIHVLFIFTCGEQPTITHPRTLVVAEENSQFKLIEHYTSLNGSEYFTNAVTEIVAADNVVANHFKLVCEGEQGYHVGTLQLNQGRSSAVSSYTISFGGALVRNNIGTLLNGEGADCVLDGLYMLDGKQHVDNHLRVDHSSPHCTSREYFKGILRDRSRAVFTGRIIVQPGAQKTDAKQSNMNLLLSDGAQVDTKPQLEIYADDVKCTHGATIGQIDENALFYMRSRGIAEDDARNLLVYAFAHDSLDRITTDSVRNYLETLLIDQLPETRALEAAVR